MLGGRSVVEPVGDQQEVRRDRVGEGARQCEGDEPSRAEAGEEGCQQHQWEGELAEARPVAADRGRDEREDDAARAPEHEEGAEDLTVASAAGEQCAQERDAQNAGEVRRVEGVRSAARKEPEHDQLEPSRAKPGRPRARPSRASPAYALR